MAALKRTAFTFVASVEGTGIVTGIATDGTLTDAAGRALDEESGQDTARGLVDGSIKVASIHKVGSFVRRHLKHGAAGRADYIKLDRMDQGNLSTFAAFLPANAKAKGLSKADAKAALTLVKGRYGI